MGYVHFNRTIYIRTNKPPFPSHHTTIAILPIICLSLIFFSPQKYIYSHPQSHAHTSKSHRLRRRFIHSFFLVKPKTLSLFLSPNSSSIAIASPFSTNILFSFNSIKQQALSIHHRHFWFNFIYLCLSSFVSD